MQSHTERYKIIVAPHAFIMKDWCVLLGKRKNTDYEDGKYHVPAGHMEEGETLLEGLEREMYEELGITVSKEACQLVHTVYHRSVDDRLQVFFHIKDWKGDVVNKEVHKCEGWEWIDMEKLPPNTVDYTKRAIEAYMAGVSFSEVVSL